MPTLQSENRLWFPRHNDADSFLRGDYCGSWANWLASHPSNDKRLEDIKQVAAQYKGNYVHDGRARYMQAIGGMVFGESREQGVTRGRNFYHEALGIALTAPEGWKIQNEPDAITLINPAGDASLIVNMAPPKAGSSHEEIIRNVLQPEQRRVAVAADQRAFVHAGGQPQPG